MGRSLLIISPDREKGKKFAKNFCTEEKINLFDITTISENNEVSSKKTAGKQDKTGIGIDIIKNLQRLLYLKPLKGEKKAIVLHEAQTLTIPAQNALLKTLEEPPEHAFFLLLADSKDSLLETILSRCQIIELPNLVEKPLPNQVQTQEFIANLNQLTIADCLLLAEKIAPDKTSALFWLENTILYMRQALLSKENTQARFSYKIRALQKTHTLLKNTNVNPRLTLENLLLSF